MPIPNYILHYNMYDCGYFVYNVEPYAAFRKDKIITI